MYMYWISIFLGLKYVTSSIDMHSTSLDFTKDGGGTGYISNTKDMVLGRRQLDLSQFFPQKVEKSNRENGPKRGKNYEPSIGYEPYWAGGDWVFNWFHDMLAQNKTSSFCDTKCSPIYTRYGKICGRNKFFNYETFDEYCDLLNKECVEKQGWMISHSGECRPTIKLLYPDLISSTSRTVPSMATYYIKSFKERHPNL